MAAFTLTDVARFPTGTTVTIYRAEQAKIGQAPSGSSITTGTMSSTGVQFTGLEQEGEYVAYAIVNGQHRYQRVQAEPDYERVFSDRGRIDALEYLTVGSVRNVLQPIGLIDGADRTGVVDAWDSFQAHIEALNADGGGRLQVPEGTFKLSAPLVLYSNVTLQGAGASSVLLANDGWSGSVITATGTLGTSVNVSGDYERGDSVITTTTAHGLAAGDYVRIIGQRNAVSDDADDDWRLGYGTPSSGTAYYAEYLQVNTVDSATQFTAYSGLVFPDYRDDATLETDPNARSRTTIQKVSFVENATVQGINVVIGTGQVGTTNAFVRGDYARNLSVRDCNVDHGGQVGSAVYFKDSLDCTADGVSCEYEQGVALDPAVHAQYTSFLMNGSQSCEFRGCISRNSGQNFDVTYSNLGCVSLLCTIADCRVYSPWSSGMTSHGGTYAISFLDNKMYGVSQGIVCRSRNSVINGNTAIYNGVGGLEPTSANQYAYGIYEGWAADCVISNNTAVGFNAGVGIVDGADAGETFRYAGVSITGNTFTKCVHGVSRFKAGTAVENCVGVVITGNVFHDNTGAVIYLESTDDVVINGNYGHDLAVGIDLDSCENGSITGNVFRANVVGVGDGVDLSNDTTKFVVNSNVWGDWANGIRLNSSIGNVVTANNFDGCTNNISTAHVGNIIADNPFTGSVQIASASTIEVPSDMRYVQLTGTTAVNTITADYVGRIVVIRLASTATITNAGNVKLAGTFGGATDETLALISDGVNWRPFMRDA